MEMAMAVAQAMLQGTCSPVALLGTTIAAPLILPHPAAAPAAFQAVLLSAGVSPADGCCTLFSAGATHVTSRFAPLSVAAAAHASEASAAATEAVAAQCSEPLAAEYAYRQLAAAGLEYGPSFRLLRNIKRGGRLAASTLSQPSAQLPAEFLLNPAVLDSCLQLGGMVPPQQAAAESSRKGTTYIPASLDALFLRAAISSSSAPGMAVAERPAGTFDSEAAVLRNHAVIGGTGSLVCRLEGLQSKSTGGKVRAAPGAAAAAGHAQHDMLYEIGWAAADLVLSTPPAGSSSSTSVALSSSAMHLAAASIAAVQGALAGAAASLQLHTGGQHPVTAVPAGASSRTEAGQLWGLLRATAAECQSLSVSGADADAADSPSQARCAQLVLSKAQAASLQPFDGYGSAAAGGSRYLPLMLPSAARSSPAPFQLLPQPRGALQNLRPVPLDASMPVPAGQVLVAVKAVGINFR